MNNSEPDFLDDDGQEPLVDDADSLEVENEEPGEADIAFRRPDKASPTAKKLEPLVLAHVLHANYRPVKPKVIAKQLAIPSEQVPGLKLCIRRLVKQGKLKYGSGHLVCPPAKGEAMAAKPATIVPQRPEPVKKPLRLEVEEPLESEEDGDDALPRTPSRREQRDAGIVGKFKRAAGGFGFVRPLTAPRSAERSLDVFIPANRTRDAVSGDTVRIRIVKDRRSFGRGGDARISGEIIEIVERQTSRFVGLYAEKRGQAYVTIDGGKFAEPVWVGDPGAKGAAPGDKVVLEMTRFPEPGVPGEGVITDVLGERGMPGVDTLSIIHEFGLPMEFPEAVLAESREQADRFDESLTGRADLTAETVITIDPVDARDFDDAISLQKNERGHWLLGVHIADVSHFVPLNSQLDREARERATSVYLPDRVIPMIPEVISNSLASLQPNRVRYTQTCWIEFTDEGVPVHAHVERAAIQSKRRFTYEEVDSFLENREPWKSMLTPEVYQLLENMHTLAMVLRQRRMLAGSIELTLPEVKIDLDKQGKVSGAHRVENTVSHQIIEEFMLAANVAVAEILYRKRLHFLRRIHEQPSLKKLQLLTTFVHQLGIPAESLESRFEIKKLIAKVAGQPEEQAVNYSILRSMQKAVYSPSEEGHYALGMEHYCHFTSPIRRYPDLTIHRMLNDLAAGKKPANDLGKQTMLGDHCSQREQRAEQAERELVKMKLLGFLADKVGLEFDAVITGVEEFGLFAQGVELPAEGLIATESLADDSYRFDRDTHTLVGYRQGNHFRLGDRIKARVVLVDMDRRELNLQVVGRSGSGKRFVAGEKERWFVPKGAKRSGEPDDEEAKKRRHTGKPSRNKRRGTR